MFGHAVLTWLTRAKMQTTKSLKEFIFFINKYNTMQYNTIFRKNTNHWEYLIDIVSSHPVLSYWVNILTCTSFFY